MAGRTVRAALAAVALGAVAGPAGAAEGLRLPGLDYEAPPGWTRIDQGRARRVLARSEGLVPEGLLGVWDAPHGTPLARLALGRAPRVGGASDLADASRAGIREALRRGLAGAAQGIRVRSLERVETGGAAGWKARLALRRGGRSARQAVWIVGEPDACVIVLAGSPAAVEAHRGAVAATVRRLRLDPRPSPDRCAMLWLRTLLLAAGLGTGLGGGRSRAPCAAAVRRVRPASTRA